MDELDEKVLDIQQRQKRAQIMRRYASKIERAREMAKKRMAPEANIRKRAFVMARQLVRKRVAGQRGAEYEKLGPSEKIAIDRAVEGKQKQIKKLALRLIPRVKQAEQKRLSSYMKGQQLQNHGQKEGKSKESSGSSSVKESINNLFQEAFPPGDTSNVMGQNVASPVSQNSKKMPAKDKSKSSEIIQHNKFQEEVELDTPAFAALFKKSDKSGVDIEILGEVYNRGWNTWTESCKVSQQQYAFARVNSYINQGKTYFNEDSDLHGEELNELTDEEKAKRLALIKYYVKNKTTKVPEGRAKGVLPKGKNQFASKTIGKFNKYKGKGGSGALANTVSRKAVIGEDLDLDEGRAPREGKIVRYKRPDGSTALKSLNKWGKRKDWRDSEGGLAKAKEHAGVDKVHEDIQIDEVSKATLKSYSQKAEKQTRGNQPHGADALRKRTNREKGLKAAYNKYYGYKTKVPATEEVQIDEMGGDQHYSDTRGATSGGAKGTPITRKKAAKDATATLNKAFKKEVQQTNENFIDGKGPGKPGDSARHGLKGKSAAELRKIRSSDTASPRKKQLAHWLLNMHHNEETELDEKRGLWDNIHAKRARIKAGSGERMRKPGSKGAPTKQDFKDAQESVQESYNVNDKHYKALTDLDLNTKNRDMTTKHDGYGPLNPLDKKGSKAFWEDKAKMWNTTTEAAMEARCRNCAAFNQAPAIMKKMAEGLGPAGEKIQDLANLGFCELFEFKCAGERTCNKWLVNGPITEEDTGNGTRLVDKESKNSKARKKIETVDRKPPHTEYTRQAEIKTKVIDENSTCPICNGKGCKCSGNSQNDPKKRLIGTDSLVKAYKKDTPFSESLDESFNIAFAAGIGVTLTAADLGMKAQSGFAYHPSVIEEMDEVEEEVRSADYKGVIVRTASGKTVVRKQKVDRKIIGSGNLTDGQPDDTV